MKFHICMCDITIKVVQNIKMLSRCYVRPQAELQQAYRECMPNDQ